MYPENIVGIIPDLSSGFLGQRVYTLVVTNYRLIFAEKTNDMVKQEIERAKAQAEANGAGFFGKWKASAATGFNFHNRYYNIPLQAILQENPNNYEIRPEQIKSIKVRSGHHDQRYGTTSPNKMVIKWTGGKEKYSFENLDTDKVKNILFQVIGSKVC